MDLFLFFTPSHRKKLIQKINKRKFLWNKYEKTPVRKLYLHGPAFAAIIFGVVSHTHNTEGPFLIENCLCV